MKVLIESCPNKIKICQDGMNLVVYSSCCEALVQWAASLGSTIVWRCGSCDTLMPIQPERAGEISRVYVVNEPDRGYSPAHWVSRWTGYDENDIDVRIEYV